MNFNKVILLIIFYCLMMVDNSYEGVPYKDQDRVFGVPLDPDSARMTSSATANQALLSTTLTDGSSCDEACKSVRVLAMSKSYYSVWYIDMKQNYTIKFVKFLFETGINGTFDNKVGLFVSNKAPSIDGGRSDIFRSDTEYYFCGFSPTSDLNVFNDFFILCNDDRFQARGRFVVLMLYNSEEFNLARVKVFAEIKNPDWFLITVEASSVGRSANTNNPEKGITGNCDGTDYAGDISMQSPRKWWFVNLPRSYYIIAYVEITMRSNDEGIALFLIVKNSVASFNPAAALGQCGEYVNSVNQFDIVFIHCNKYLTNTGKSIVLVADSLASSRLAFGFCNFKVVADMGSTPEQMALTIDPQRAIQSSISGNYHAKLGIVGDCTDSNDGWQYSRTGFHFTAVWMVDFEQHCCVERIQFGLPDNSYSSFMTQTTVTITKKPFDLMYPPDDLSNDIPDRHKCSDYFSSMKPGEIIHIRCGRTKCGRYLTVMVKDSQLQLCRMKIYAYTF